MEANILAKKDLSQIQDYVVQILPQLLREKPEITATIEGILAHQFPRRNKFISLLEEVKLLHGDMNQRFELMDRKFDLMDRKFEAQRKETEQRFELMDRKFEAHRKETEQRFNVLHEEMNQRFEQVDQRLDKQHQEIRDVKRRVIKLESTVDRMDEKITRFDLRLNMLAGTLGNDRGC